MPRPRKAGPVTLTEAFSKELPVIITGYVPGQEEGNVQYVKSKKLGYVVNKKSEIIEVLRRLINSKSELEFIKVNIRKERKIAGASKVAELIMNGGFQNRLP